MIVPTEYSIVSKDQIYTVYVDMSYPWKYSCPQLSRNIFTQYLAKCISILEIGKRNIQFLVCEFSLNTNDQLKIGQVP